MARATLETATNYIKTKLSQHEAEREIKQVATASEPPVVIPVIVVAVDVHVALVVPVVEGVLYKVPPKSSPLVAKTGRFEIAYYPASPMP